MSELDEQRERLRGTLERLDIPGTGGQVEAYMNFRDALEAAGLAAAVGEDEARVCELLGRAARESIDVFALRGTHVSEVRELPGGRPRQSVDTSATNPSTVVRALYSAAAAGDEEALERLAGLDPAEYHSKQVVAGAALEAFAPLLQSAVRGDGDLGKRARAALEGWDEGDVGRRVWLTQLRALERLAEADREGFDRAVDEVAEAERAYLRSRDESEGSRAALGLAVRGLRALADRRGL